MKHHGKIIKQRIDQLGVNQTKLAEKLNMSRQNMSHVLTRETIHNDLLKRLGEALETDFIQILYKKEEAENIVEESKIDHEQYILQGRLRQVEMMLEKKEVEHIEEAMHKVFAREMKRMDKIIKSCLNEIHDLNAFIKENYDWEPEQIRNSKTKKG